MSTDKCEDYPCLFWLCETWKKGKCDVKKEAEKHVNGK